MKKLAVLMGLVLVMALALPAAAGVSTDITGKVWGKVEYKDGELSGKGKAEAKIGLSAGSEGAIKAVVDIAGWSVDTGEKAFGDNALTGASNLELKINSAYVQTTGSWFKGMAKNTTKIGRFEVNYNDWVAAISGSSAAKNNTDKGRGNQNAIEVAGIDLGGLNLTLANVWLATDSRAAVVSGSVDLDVVKVSGAVLSHEGDHTDFAIEATAAPADGVSVTAEFASDGLNSDTAYKVSGSLGTIAGLDLSATLWNTGKDFNPEFARWADGDDDGDDFDHATKFTTDRSGYEVKANTTQSGIDLGLTYKNEGDAAGNNPVTTTEVTAGTTVSETTLKATAVMKSNENDPKFVVEASRAFGSINGSYKFTREHNTDVIQEISADTTVDTPFADGVKLSFKTKLTKDDTKVDADAAWTAPNGIKLGLHYANYAGGDYAENLSARAELEVTF